MREVVRRARAVDVGPRPARRQVPVTNLGGLLGQKPTPLQRRAQETHAELKRSDAQHERVHLTLERGHLARGPDGVAHELGVAAGEHDDARDPIRVAKRAPPKQHVIHAHAQIGTPVGTPVGTQADPLTLELVQLVVGSLALDHRALERLLEDNRVGIGTATRSHPGDGARSLRLEVRLAVEVGRLDEAHAGAVRGLDAHDVGGELLVVAHERDIADAEVLPSDRLQRRREGAQRAAWRVFRAEDPDARRGVDRRVGAVPEVIVVRLFGGVYGQDEREGRDGRGPVRRGEPREEDVELEHPD